jgi:hypothetical protein
MHGIDINTYLSWRRFGDASYSRCSCRLKKALPYNVHVQGVGRLPSDIVTIATTNIILQLSGTEIGVSQIDR